MSDFFQVCDSSSLALAKAVSFVVRPNLACLREFLPPSSPNSNTVALLLYKFPAAISCWQICPLVPLKNTNWWPPCFLSINYLAKNIAQVSNLWGWKCWKGVLLCSSLRNHQKPGVNINMWSKENHTYMDLQQPKNIQINATFYIHYNEKKQEWFAASCPFFVQFVKGSWCLCQLVSQIISPILYFI